LTVRSPIDADALEGDEAIAEEPFSPAFTYPIFGEQEKIFGYQGLNIQVSGLRR
jgi:histone acetyltransferase 1